MLKLPCLISAECSVWSLLQEQQLAEQSGNTAVKGSKGPAATRGDVEEGEGEWGEFINHFLGVGNGATVGIALIVIFVSVLFYFWVQIKFPEDAS